MQRIELATLISGRHIYVKIILIATLLLLCLDIGKSCTSENISWHNKTTDMQTGGQNHLLNPIYAYVQGDKDRQCISLLMIACMFEIIYRHMHNCAV